MSGLQFRVALLCSFVLVFEGYDIGSIGFAIPALASSWGLSPAAFTLSIVLTGVGMLLGAVIAGPLGDWYGRKPVFVACVITFAMFSLATALLETTHALAAMRFLTGLGLGGGVPTAIALTSDYLPAKNRAILVGVMTGGVPVGLMIGGLVSSKLIPNYGWQAIFIVGGVFPLLILPLIVFLLPESVQILLAKDKSSKEAARILKRMGIEPSSLYLPPVLLLTVRTAVARNPVARLFQDGNTARTVLLWIMFLCNFLSTWLIIFWLPTILNAAGANAGDAAFYSALLPVGGLVGVVGIAMIASRFGTEKTLAVALLGGAAAIFAMWWGNPSVARTAVLIFLIGAGLMGAQFGMNGLSGSVYPTQIRATGSGWAFGVGRLGNIIGPGLGGLVLGLAFPPKTMFLVAILPVVIAAIAMGLLSRERSAGRLEDKTPREDAARFVSA